MAINLVKTIRDIPVKRMWFFLTNTAIMGEVQPQFD